MADREKQRIIARYVKACLSILAVVAFFFAISFAKGAGWKPMLIPLPLFLILFVGVTYQLTRDVRALRRRHQDKEIG